MNGVLDDQLMQGVSFNAAQGSSDGQWYSRAYAPCAKSTFYTRTTG